MQPGIAQGAFQRLAQAGQQGLGGFVKFVAGNDGGNDAAADIDCDFCLHFFAQFPFCGFQGLPQFAAVAQFGAFGIAQFFALAQEAVAQYLYEVFPTQMVVARTGGYLHHAVEIVQNGYVERAAAQVVNQETGVVGLFLQAVGQAGGGRFVQQAQDVQPGHLRRIARSLPLDGVEIGRHGDDGFVHGFAQKRFRVFLQAAQQEGGQFFGAEGFIAELEGFVRAHKAFEGRGGGLGRGAQAFACGEAD